MWNPRPVNNDNTKTKKKQKKSKSARNKSKADEKEASGDKLDNKVVEEQNKPDEAGGVTSPEAELCFDPLLELERVL